MPKIVDKKKKANAISDAALKVFRELGYNQTRMVDIAQMAGMGKGTLYEYFKDKAAILQFSFDQYFSVFSKGSLMEHQCTGVILAGGLNTRFSGKKKALEKIGGKAILSYTYDLFQDVFDEVILVTTGIGGIIHRSRIPRGSFSIGVDHLFKRLFRQKPAQQGFSFYI